MPPLPRVIISGLQVHDILRTESAKRPTRVSVAASTGTDVVIEVDGGTTRAAADRFLRFLLRYVDDVGGVALRAGEAIVYGSWVVRFGIGSRSVRRSPVGRTATTTSVAWPTPMSSSIDRTHRLMWFT